MSCEFCITPLLYGSLGLEYLFNTDIASDDIDILVPRVFINERFAEFTADTIAAYTKKI